MRGEGREGGKCFIGRKAGGEREKEGREDGKGGGPDGEGGK